LTFKCFYFQNDIMSRVLIILYASIHFLEFEIRKLKF